MNPGINISEIQEILRTERCFADARVIDSMYFQCDFQYPSRKIQPTLLGEKIDAQYGIDKKECLIYIDDVEFLFGKYNWENVFRLENIDLYTNTNQWAKRKLGPAPRPTQDSFLVLDAVEEDPGPYSLKVGHQIAYDPESARLAFKFQTDGGECRWFRLADEVAVAFGSKGLLKCILFECIYL